MEAQLVTVEVHRGAHIYAAEVDADNLVPPLLGGGEGLAVPPGTAGQVAALGLTAAGITLFDAVIVGQVHVSPARIVVVKPGAALT